MSQQTFINDAYTLVPQDPGLLLSLGFDFYRRLLDELNDGVCFVDCESRILYWNRGAERLTGYSSDEVVGCDHLDSPFDHASSREDPDARSECPVFSSMRSGLPSRRQVFFHHRDGHRIAVDVYVTPIRNEREEVVGCVKVFRDASSILELERSFSRLKEQALNDPLTGLANRRQLDTLLNTNLDLFRRTGTPFSLIMADLDHFKWVNDTYGHLAGDLCLKLVANCFQQDCRVNDVIGRFGGEEFLLILPRKREAAARRLAERLRLGVLSIAPPELLGGVTLTASFGVCEAYSGDSHASIIERVDKALYQAKAKGRNRVVSSRSLVKNEG